MTMICQLCEEPAVGAVCDTCEQLRRGADWEALDVPTNPFDIRLEAMAIARGITEPDDIRLLDVLNDFMAQLREEGTADEYNRLVMRDLVDAGAMPLLTRVSNKHHRPGKKRRKKKRR